MMWTQFVYFIDSKTNEFTNNYTIDNAQYRVEGKNIKHYLKYQYCRIFLGLQQLSLEKNSITSTRKTGSIS